MTEDTNLSEFAGRLVRGFTSDTRRKILYSKYMSPTLNGVKISKSLQTKCPPTNTKEGVVFTKSRNLYTILNQLAMYIIISQEIT